MSSALPGSAPGQSPEATLPPGGGTVYAGGSPNFDETTGQYRNLPGGMTLGGKGGVPTPPGTPPPPPPDFVVGPTLPFKPIIPDESGGRVTAPPPPAPPNMFDTAANSIYDAMDATRGVMNYQPMMINPGSYSANTIDPSQFNLGFENVGFGTVGANQIGFDRITSPEMQAAQTTQADIDRFLNPYTTEVVDQSMADIERNRLMQANQAAAQAQAAGAFGGSRGALMEAEIARNALDQSARTAGDLRRQGFTTAAQLAQQDVARRQQAGTLNAQQALQAALANQRSGLQAGMSNQQANLQAQLANQRSGLQAALANQQAGLTTGMANMDAGLRSLLANQGALNAASQFNINQDQSAQALNQAMGLQGMQNQLAAANQLANLGNLGYNQATDQLAGVNQAGNQQQALLQMLLGNANAQTQNIIGQPDMDLQRLISVLSGVPFGTSQTTRSSPGLLDIAQTGAMIASLFPSDQRLKDNIQLVGKTEGSHNIYSWTWNELAKDIGADRYPTVGVMAQEVKATQPEAVVEGEHGYLMVDYSKVH